MTTTTATTDNATTVASRVTVLGLGSMGSAIARTFVDGGYHTTVWNRTANKSGPLVDVGATAAATAAEAVAASPLVVVCLLDGAAVDEVLASVDDVVAGKVLVNLTSGSPAQARANERWARERGAEYIDGKLMGDPPYVGTPNITVLLSGSRSAFDAHASTLRELGGIGYHGEDAGLAAVEFMAQVAMGYEMLIGFLHVLKLVRAEGVDVTEFAERVAGSLAAYPPLLTTIAKAVASGEYPPDLGSLRVQAALMDDMIEHRKSVGVEAMRMRQVKELMDRRIADGHGEQGFSSLFELLAKGRLNCVMSHRDETILLFRNTMRITDGHLEDFRNAIARAVEFARQHGPQLMVQTFVDEKRMLAHSFQLYRDSDAVRLHWKLADPFIQDVMKHCRVEHFEVFGEPDAEVAAGLRSSLGEQTPLTFFPQIAGFLRFGAALDIAAE